MAVILSGETVVLECGGCGEMYLVGSAADPKATKDWRDRHARCPSVSIVLRAAVPKLKADLEALFVGRLGELAGEASLCWEKPQLAGVFQADQASAAAQRAATDVALLAIEKLELGLLPGRLENAARMIHDMQGTIEGLEAALQRAACMWCGYETPRDLDAARAHLEVCEKHPMAQVRAELEEYRQRLAGALTTVEGNMLDVQERPDTLAFLRACPTIAACVKVRRELEELRARHLKLGERVIELEAEVLEVRQDCTEGGAKFVLRQAREAAGLPADSGDPSLIEWVRDARRAADGQLEPAEEPVSPV